jgi:hypothetical protein
MLVERREQQQNEATKIIDPSSHRAADLLDVRPEVISPRHGARSLQAF